MRFDVHAIRSVSMRFAGKIGQEASPSEGILAPHPCGFLQPALLEEQATYVCTAVFACWVLVSLAGRLKAQVFPTDIATSFQRRRGALAVVNAVGFLGTLVMIRRSFIDRHDFPYVPLFGIGILEDSQGFLRLWQICNFTCLIVSLLAVIFTGVISCCCSNLIDAKLLRVSARMALCFTFLLLMADTSQCQPYLLYFAATLIDLALQKPPLDQSAIAARDIAPVLWVFLGLQYTYAGLCKHNTCFNENPVVAETLPPQVEAWVHTFMSWPLEEKIASNLESMLGLAVLLGSSRIQAIAAVPIAVMHALLILGLKHHQWNPQVWPWNACGFVTVLLVLVPSPTGGLSWENKVDAQGHGKTDAKGTASTTRCLQILVLILFGIGPLLHILGLPWDTSVSMSLYSAEIEQTVMYINGVQKNQFEDPKGFSCNLVMPGGLVDYDGWVQASNDFYPYIAPRMFLKHARFIAQRFEASVSVGITGRPKNTLFGRLGGACSDGAQLSRFTCDANGCQPYSRCRSQICISECAFPSVDLLECGNATSVLQSHIYLHDFHRSALRI